MTDSPSLTKQDLLSRCVPADIQTLDLPRGGCVRVLPVGAKLFREYRRCLRDEQGNPIKAREEFIDELLVARVLVDNQCNRIFTDEEVLAGCFDRFPPADMDAINEYVWSFIGAGDREKKSLPTPSGKPA